MSKSFSHAGVSKQDGAFKVRFANDALRTKVLIKNGHTDIDIIELKHPMSKLEAVAYLLEIDFDNGNKAIRAALEAALDKRSPVVKEAKAPKAKAAPKAKQTPAKAKVAKAPKAVETVAEAAPKVDLGDMEDAPY